jgi:HEAT repeat protein
VVKGGAIPFGTPGYDLAQTAMRALQSLGPKAAPAVPELVAILRTEDRPNTNADDYLRRAAAETLGRVGPPAIPALVEALADPALEVHAAAARTLPQISPDAVPPELVNALGTNAATPRTLGWTFQGFGEKGIQALTAALRHPNRDVRLRTIAILRSLSAKPKTAIPALKRASEEDQDPLVRQEAVEALRDIEQSSRGQPPLRREKDKPAPTRP